MKKLILLLLTAYSINGFSQAITVNTSTYSVPQLVNTVLINSPCVSATNITWKTGTNFGSSNGIGFFQNSNPNFPMQAGVILSTGQVTNSVGPNTTSLNDGAANWPGDSSLENTLIQAGIPMNSINATILEFDFTPISPTFSFDFLFASEEYGNFQCQFSDAFAFLLTNTLTGVTTNLAVVPNTNLPISVVTIRDFLYNSSCPSANSQFFGNYNGGSSANSAAINFNGQTKLLNAAATLIPNTTYHIKLVIADRTDLSSDSAIFISSDTFNIGQDVLGLDLTIANNTAICFGSSHVITSNLNPANYTFSWTKDNIAIPGANGPNLTTTEPGVYGLTYQKIVNGCQPVTDFINVEYFSEFITINPSDLYKCNTGAGSYLYDLSYNTPIVKAWLDPLTQVSYHATLANANAGTNPLNNNYSSTPGQTIYVRIKKHNTPCFVVKSFQLLTSPAPVAVQPPNMIVCARSVSINNGIFQFSQQNNTVLNGQSSTLNTVTYHVSQTDANSGTNPLATNGYIGTNNTTIYVRVQNITDSSCYSTTNFTLTIDALPLVDTLESIVLCEDYVLPELTNGNYFSGPNGTGDPLFAGNIITETQTIYIFNQPNAPDGCSSGSTFKVTIIDPLTLAPSSGTFCGKYNLPELSNGNYYTGPAGTGTLLNAGDSITSSQTIYVYFQSILPPFCVIDTDFVVTIIPKINIGNFENVFDCNAYTLPSLTAGNYYTETGGGGQQIAEGSIITTSQTVFVYAVASNGCISQESFEVIIGFEVPVNVSQCEPYTLPELVIGNYYTGPAGTGTLIPDGTIINLTQTIYMYIPSSSSSNCTDNINFNVAISQPIIDILADVNSCGSYVLPTLNSGEYYTDIDGTGTLLHAGDFITTSQIIYIFKRSTVNCSNQSSFEITINERPLIDSRADIDLCNSYELTQLTVGNYFTGPNGTGTMLPAGTIISTSQLIYIYAISVTTPDCIAENSFNINIFAIEADAPTNVVVCDSYVLPELTVGNYYTLSGGPTTPGNILKNAGDVITSSIMLYVYTESGERINCSDENSFSITINVSPIIAPISNKKACNTYTLPTISIGNYFTGANGSGTMLNIGDIISADQTIYVYAQSGTIPNCTDEKSFTVTLFNVPELSDITICENYTLSPLTSGGYYTGPIGTGTHLLPGQAINSTQTIYVYAVSPFSPVCYDESSFNVTIVDTPITYSIPSNMTTICDEDETNDGVTLFDLTELNTTILGTQTGAEYTVTYYANQEDAVAGINSIVSTILQSVYVRVSNTLTANCFDIKSFTIKVNKIPEPSPIDGLICYDSETSTLLNPYTIQSGLSATTHTFQWFNETNELVGTNSIYQAIEPGIYSLIATNSLTGCASLPVSVTILSSEPAVVSYAITDDFSDNQIITIEATGVGGDYEYQLDFGPFQDSPIFQNVSTGTHTVTVRDKNGCGNTVTAALVVNYPKFFTPNADGYNDTWNIVDLKNQSKSIINIFDRYGKLLKQIYPNGPGWDGSYEGIIMPSTDYWFTVSYEEDGISKEFKSHFAMKK